MLDKFANTRDPNDKGTAKPGLVPKLQGLNPIISIFSVEFVELAQAEIDFNTEKAVGIYNRKDKQ